jgi:DDE superfamily endonuclease
MNHLPRIIIPFLLPFSIAFHANKSFLKIVLLFVGGISCRAGRTVCGCLRILGMKGERAFANYHHLLSRCKFDMLCSVKVLIEMILPLVGTDVVFVVDEHLERRRGDKIKAKATYRDPVASSKSRLVKCFGLKWIVLAILVTFPWSRRPFALPVFCVLRKPEDHPKNLKRKTRSGTDLICQMLIVVRRWFPSLTITLLGDGDYARVKLCDTCRRLSISLVSRMRADARLHDFVSEGKRKGRRPKVGKRLTKPEDNSWGKLAVQWYGGQVKEVLVAAKNCLWLAGKESAVITIQAVWVRLRAGDEILLMTTSLNMSVHAIIEGYIKRWQIEVTFRESRDYLGVETQRQWSDLAVERCTPLLFALYTLTTIIGNAIYAEKGIIAEWTAWYSKPYLTFSDILETVRQELGDACKIANSLLGREFRNELPLEGLQGELLYAEGF